MLSLRLSVNPADRFSGVLSLISLRPFLVRITVLYACRNQTTAYWKTPNSVTTTWRVLHPIDWIAFNLVDLPGSLAVTCPCSSAPSCAAVLGDASPMRGRVTTQWMRRRGCSLPATSPHMWDAPGSRRALSKRDASSPRRRDRERCGTRSPRTDAMRPARRWDRCRAQSEIGPRCRA